MQILNNSKMPLFDNCNELIGYAKGFVESDLETLALFVKAGYKVPTDLRIKAYDSLKQIDCRDWYIDQWMTFCDGNDMDDFIKAIVQIGVTAHQNLPRPSQNLFDDLYQTHSLTEIRILMKQLQYDFVIEAGLLPSPIDKRSMQWIDLCARASLARNVEFKTYNV